jgi:hypothetical protein
MKKILNKCFDKDYPKDLSENDSESVGGVYDVYKKGFESAYRLKDNDKRLDLANAQLIGYFAGKWTGLIGMIEAMNLTKKEWEKLKKDYEPNLDENDFNEIEDYFNSVS